MQRFLASIVLILLSTMLVVPLAEAQEKSPSRGATTRGGQPSQQGYLGAQFFDLSPKAMASLAISRKSALLVMNIVRGAPAERSGLKAGDVVIAMNGEGVTTAAELVDRIKMRGAGARVVIDVVRQGRQIEIAAKLIDAGAGRRLAASPQAMAKHADHQLVDLEQIGRLYPLATHPDVWALSRLELGIASLSRTRGEQSANVEQAISAIGEALKIVTRDTDPGAWARATNAIATAYTMRTSGERAKNLEKALETYRSLEPAMSRENDPEGWATVQHNLASLYFRRISGSRSDNIEQSISLSKGALAAVSRDRSPEEWARSWQMLAAAYGQRIEGDRADNLEEALAAHQQVLSVLSRETAPFEWAKTQNDLGLTYRDRVRGEHWDNIERSIAALEKAAGVLSRETAPYLWAKLQNNLGETYVRRVRGDKSENIEKSIFHIKKALTLQTREETPRDWTSSLISLARAYLQRVRGTASDNQEEALKALQAALTVLSRDAEPQSWAEAQFELGSVYEDRATGDRAENLERSLDAYQAALTVYRREAWPLQWATVMTGLGGAYLHRTKGERAENVEKAIEAYSSALTFFTRDRMPREWAQSLHNLSSAYADRIRGDRSDNMERAISGFESVLTVRTRQALPSEWADTQLNLAVAYADRVAGDHADNLEKSIAAYGAALEVHTRDAFPRSWAQIQNNLGTSYSNRVVGDHAENIERAIASYERALSVRTKHGEPHDWASTQANLGVAYFKRIRGARSENLERAIEATEAALTVRTRASSPTDWAHAQANLGNYYGNRIRGRRADNIEKALAVYEAALEVLTRDGMPRDWAQGQNNLGLTYVRRLRGDREENLEKAIAAYRQALAVQTDENLPLNRANTEHNLGIALRYRVKGDRSENLKLAIAAQQSATNAYGAHGELRMKLQASRELGAALLAMRDLKAAAAAYREARNVFQQLLGESLDTVTTESLVSSAGRIFAEASYVAAQSGDVDEAIELAMEGRARLMALALKLNTLKLDSRTQSRLTSLRSGIRVAERAIETSKGDARAAALDRLNRLRADLQRLIAGHDTASTSAKAAIRRIVDQGHVILLPIMTDAGGMLLVVSRGAGGPRITRLDLPALPRQLELFLNGSGGSGGWLRAYGAHYADVAEQQQRWPEWLAALDRSGQALWELVGGPIQAELDRLGVAQGTRLVWLPTGPMGILPLGLAQAPGTREHFSERYDITYAPSLSAIDEIEQSPQAPRSHTLGAVSNPTGDLPGARREVAIVASHFSPAHRQVADGPSATTAGVLSMLKGKSHWHFATHGTFSWRDARDSGLVMHNGERLSVSRLLEAEGLGRPTLVVLSACESGLYDYEGNPEEFIGLPSTFLALGASGVLGTLWPVEDAATALLMARFYELHLADGLHPSKALAQAQSWLRRATTEDLETYVKAAVVKARLRSHEAQLLAEELRPEQMRKSRNASVVEWTRSEGSESESTTSSSGPHAQARPFAHPYFWAGFVYTGQ